MIYGYRYNVKEMDSGALAITFPAFPEIVSVIFPEDDIAKEAQLTLIHAVNNLLEFGFAVPEAEEVSDENAQYAQISPYVLSAPTKYIYHNEGAISQNNLENLIQEAIPNLGDVIPKNKISIIKMEVIEKYQDILEDMGNKGRISDNNRIMVEIVRMADDVHAEVKVLQAAA